MGNRYIVQRSNVTPTAGNDLLTIVSASNRRVRLVQVAVAGRGTTSAAQLVTAGRSTGGTTGGGAITPNKYDHTEQPAAASTVNTTWSGQPTLETNQTPLGYNALGGAIILNVAKMGIEARNGENISIRAPSGPTYQAMDISAVFEED